MSSSGPVKDADEQEVFEIQDYTTASEWERFTAGVEETLHDWQLVNSECQPYLENIDLKSKDVEWQEKMTTIKFSDYLFNITHHFITYNHSEEQIVPESSKGEKEEESLPNYLLDILNFKNDFPGKAHCLVRWYGLKEFVTVVPAASQQPITSTSRGRVVLSALAMAANNTNCQVPLFLQTGELSDKLYHGVGFGSDVRTDFEMAFIRTPPPQCTHLSGLLDIFKSKLGISMTSEPVLISIRFTYILNDWSHTLWSQQPPDLDATLSDVGFSELGNLPFGALSDPVSELQVSTTWPCVSEYSLTDSDAQSDLNPSSAPIWSARLGSAFAPPCLLSEYLSEYLLICENDASIVQILGHDFDPTIDDGSNLINAFDRITGGPMASFSAPTSRFRSSSSGRNDQGPIAEETLSLLLNFLFSDTQNMLEESAAYSPSTFSHIPSWTPPVKGLPAEHPLKDVLTKIKSCDVDSFVWRLAVVICHTVHSLGGLSSVAHLFYEILLELRFRWDNAIYIPGVQEGVPDLASCLVNQKLQMLNCCIQHKIGRENNTGQKPTEESVEEEDEFFECDEDMEQESTTRYYSWDKPEGRLKRFGKARLLKRSDFIYVPVTQEAAPNTEDKLEEQKGELMRLGSDSSGSCQRARLMSTSLLSDMESFKAANPGSALEDFVRWYSPRDWIEEEGDSRQSVKGHLSNRMLIPGNLWREVWDSAKPVPARRQKRLFDDTREAERVLEWFNQLSPGNLCLELLSVVMHASVCRLAEEPVLYTLSAVKEEALPRPLHDDSLAAQLELLAKRVSRLSMQPPKIAHYTSIYYQIEIIERSISKAQSLRLKLLGHTTVSSSSLRSSCLSGDAGNSEDAVGEQTLSKENGAEDSPLESLVTMLLNCNEVTLEGGSKGVQAFVIKKLFADSLSNSYLEESPTDKTGTTTPRPNASNENDKSRDVELGKPAGREYLLRTHASYPAEHSRKLPHRLYAVVLKKSFRMAGAISQDTIFC